MPNVITLAPGVELKVKLPALLGEMHNWGYSLGAKVSPLSRQQPGLSNFTGGTTIDCSGFVLWALWHLTGGTFSLDPMTHNSGSIFGWLSEEGYEPCKAFSGHEQDSLLRCFYLNPSDTGDGIGHILLTLNGFTFESFGGHGPGSREWGLRPWMSEMRGVLLT